MTAGTCRHCGTPLRPAGSAWVDGEGWELCTDPGNTFHGPTEGEPVPTTTPAVYVHEQPRRDGTEALAVRRDDEDGTVTFTVTRMSGGTGTQLAIRVPAGEVAALAALLASEGR